MSQPKIKHRVASMWIAVERYFEVKDAYPEFKPTILGEHRPTKRVKIKLDPGTSTILKQAIQARFEARFPELAEKQSTTDGDGAAAMENEGGSSSPAEDAADVPQASEPRPNGGPTDAGRARRRKRASSSPN